jgi:ABC-type dipeptide/oligopeptide/nickel transport system permease component
MLFGVSLIAFAMAHWAPGDPILAQLGLNPRGMEPQTVERLREELGLNEPLLVQYVLYLGRLLRGDLGRSLTTREPVSKVAVAGPRKPTTGRMPPRRAWVRITARPDKPLARAVRTQS